MRCGRLFIAILIFGFALLAGRGDAQPVGAPATTLAQASVAAPGDADCNGDANALDALQILRFAAGLSAAACTVAAGDVNCDQAVTAVDALLVLRYAAGMQADLKNCGPQPTSEELIAKALAGKKIDYPTSLLYRAYALFDDPQLPRDYASDVADFDAGTALSADVAANQGQISQATADALAPFLARPNDPASAFNQPQPAAPAIAAPAAVPTWSSAPAAGGKARAWTRSDLSVKLDAATYAGVISEVWPELPAFIRAATPDTPGDPSAQVNPDSAIDIYFVPLPATNPRKKECIDKPAAAGCQFATAWGWTSVAPPRNANASSAFLVISGSLDGDNLAGTLAHELFHASQFSYDNTETSWLKESTATWGEFRVLQELGRGLHSAQMYLPGFFSGIPNRSLTSTEGTNAYGAYLFFLFGQMEQGDGFVRSVWADAAAAGAQGIDAVNDVLPMESEFKKFALRNWNQDPVTPLYSDADSTFPNEKPPIFDRELSSNNTEKLDNAILPLSAFYWDIKVPVESGIPKVKIKLDQITGVEAAGVDAIVTIQGKDPEVRHWSGSSEQTFCMDRDDEKLQDLVLVVSNGKRSGLLDGKIEIDTTQPCAEFEGTITYTFKRTGSGVDNAGRPIEVTTKNSATISFEMQPANYTEPPNAFQTSNGTVTWSINDTWVWPGSCRISTTANGSGTYQIDWLSGPQLFWKQRDGFVPDDHSYGLNPTVGPPDSYGPDDPNTTAASRQESCWGTLDLPRQPFLFIDPTFWQAIPGDGDTLSGQNNQTVPTEWPGGPPGTETITWTIHHHATGGG